jgi:hypothetical protein
LNRTLIALAIAAACSASIAGGHAPVYGNANSTANGGAAFGGQANTSGGNISSSLGGSAAANNIGGSATGNQGSVNGNSQVLTGNSASVSAGSANVTGGAMTNNLDGSVKGGTATTTSGSATTTGGNIASGVTGSAKQTQTTASGVTGSGNSQGNATSVNVEGSIYEAQARNPVSTAYAPNISPTALCALGVSGGAQGVGFGISFGNSYTDDNCVLLEQVRATAAVLGDRVTAAEMMCDVKAYREARARTGKPCKGDEAKRAEAVLEDRPVVASADPYIAARIARQGK